MTANVEAKLLEAAIAFDELRVEALRLQHKRNASQCHDVDPDDPVTYPCWRVRPADGDGWCEPCLERQHLHRELVVARERRGYALKRFSRWRQRYQESLVPPCRCGSREASHCSFDEPGVDHALGCPLMHHEFRPPEAVTG